MVIALLVVAAVLVKGGRVRVPQRGRASPAGSDARRPAENDTSRSDLTALYESARKEVEDALPGLVREMEAEADARAAALMNEQVLPAAEDEPTSAEERPISQRPLEEGPSWMHPDEWPNRLSAYRRQRRGDREIMEIREHLERRGPRTPRSRHELAARAEAAGIVSRAEYMTPDEEAEALKPGPDGLPDARLQRIRDRLLVVTPKGWVNPRSRIAPRAGLYSFALRGTGYYEAAVKTGRFTPGAPITIVREPDNEYDANAIAVYAHGARNKAGYVPKGLAKRLARLLDSGADLVAISVRGSAAGRNTVTPHILVCERRLLEHLQR